MVVGSGGAGKTTFALKLGQLLGLPVIHLDRHFWNPGWIPTPKDEWKVVVRGLAETDEWIIDGNYGGTLDIRVRRCDAIIFFDFSRISSLKGALTRSLVQRGRTRPDMSDGCPERFDWEFLRWIWNYKKSSRPRVSNAIDQAGDDVQVVTLRNRREVRNLLDVLEAEAA